jgi:pimeloyl-ACP methyl ester carboxylesterase
MKLAVALPALLVGACASWFPAPTPMRSVEWRQPAKAKCLVVFLPGFGDDAEDFERLGFVAEMKQHDLSVDMIAAQATLGYYAKGTFPDRLATDVIEPARKRGYEQVWLVGMSMGGMGTLYYARTHTAEITGLFALAPFVGDKSLTDEIRDQGGLAKWKGPARVDTLNEDNYQREIWRWLQALVGGTEQGPKLYVGYGHNDKLADQDVVLSAAMPRDHVYLAEGIHDWPTWKYLLGSFLSTSDFARGCR